MSNPLFGVFNNQPANTLQGAFGYMSNFMNGYNNLKQMLGPNPYQAAERMARTLMSSGKYTPEQIEQAKQLATNYQKVTGL